MSSVLFDDLSDIHYPKLDAKSAQIRLIVLARGALDSPIHCTYRVVNLDDENFLSYETVSYVWQDGTGTGPILVDGKTATVTWSLFGALEQLRFVDRERVLWVDAICINQSDDDEKTHQVDMMCRIYSQCRQCNIWMGQLGDISVQDATLAIDTLAWMAGDIANPPESLNDVSRRRRAAEALNALVTKPWWGRIWTVQEAILPSQRFIYWGPFSLPWERLDRACENAPADLQKYQDEFYASGAFRHMPAGVRGLRASANEHPLHLLWRWRFRQASEPRDKVYALLGMRPDFRLPNVPSCDYNSDRVDARTLFVRVTADLVNICRDLNPLIGRRGELPAVPGLPSWAVDWSGPPPGTQGSSEFWIHEKRWMNRGYCADRGVYGVGDGLQFGDKKKETLLLSGLYVDTIAVVEQRQAARSRGNGGMASHEVLLDGADRWADLIKRFQRSGTTATVELPDGWMQAFLGLIMGRLVPADPNDGDPDDWAREMLRDQAIFITQGGRFGLGPLNARPGQQLWIVGGCRFPVILDVWSDGIPGKVEDEASCRDFSWESDCFVYGMMKGEAVEGRGHEQVKINLH